MAIECPYCGADSKYLTPLQASRLLDTTETTVRRWCREGRLPAEQVQITKRIAQWRIPVTAVLPLIGAPNG